MVGLDEADRLAFGCCREPVFRPRPPATLTTCRKRWACDPKGRRGRLPPPSPERRARARRQSARPWKSRRRAAPSCMPSPSGSPATAARRWSSTTAMRARPSAIRCRRCAITIRRSARRAGRSRPDRTCRFRRARDGRPARPAPVPGLSYPGRVPLPTRPDERAALLRRARTQRRARRSRPMSSA